jgi:predicted dehydrogenase
VSKGSVHREAFSEDTVLAELADFARAIRQGTDARDTARQALGDVAVIEAMFTSAASGDFVKPEAI